MDEFDAMLSEFRTDYNQTHFVRNETFKKAADGIQVRAAPLRIPTTSTSACMVSAASAKAMSRKRMHVVSCLCPDVAGCQLLPVFLCCARRLPVSTNPFAWAARGAQW